MLSLFCLFCRAAALIKLKILTFAIQKLFSDHLFLYHFLRLPFNLFSNQFSKSDLFSKKVRLAIETLSDELLSSKSGKYLYCQRSCFHLNQESIYIKRLLQKKKELLIHNIWAIARQNQQNDLCAQWRLESAWASTQSYQSSLSAWKKLGSLATHWAHSEDSDQTGQMHRLIWVFTGHSCHFVGFVMRWLICFYINEGL